MASWGGRGLLSRGQRIDTAEETIELAGTSVTEADALANTMSDSEPRYSFFKFSHEFEGQHQAPVVFIYTCPSGSKVKERMLYASSRAGMVSAASSDAGLMIEKKVGTIINSSDIASMKLTTIHHRWRPRARPT